MINSIGHCNFMNRVMLKSGNLGYRLEFIREDNSRFYGVVTRNTLRVNFEPYSDDEWAAMEKDFEHMHNRPCGGYRYTYSELMTTFTCSPPDISERSDIA